MLEPDRLGMRQKNDGLWNGMTGPLPQSVGAAVREGLIVLGLVFSCLSAAASDWVERPFNPPAGSRWIIEMAIATEEVRRENGRDSVKNSTRTVTSELIIEAKTAAGYRVVYRRIEFSYDGDTDKAAMMRAALAALNNITLQVTADASGKPLKVKNLDDIQNGLRTMVSRLAAANDDAQLAAALHNLLGGMADINVTQAAELYLDDLPALARGQNTGLKIGEVRRASRAEANLLGTLVTNTELSIASVEPESGHLWLLRREFYDPSSIQQFLVAMVKRAGGSNAADMTKMNISLDGRTDIDVVDGMTRPRHEQSTMSANLMGNPLVTTDRKDVIVSSAP